MTEQRLLHVGFNQDNGCFAVGETNGFRIFNTNPYNEQFRRQFDGPESGIGIVEMLFRCNIFALVGGGPNPRFPCNKVMIWDDHQGRCIGELTFRNQVRAVKLRRDRIAVALDHRILVYNFADLRLIYQWETIHNSRGLLAMSSEVDSTVVACPGVHNGQVRVELMDRQDFRLIEAHNGAIVAISLSINGHRLATASEKGTLIRIFDTSTGHKLQELRRGSDPAEIYHLAFDRRCMWLGVTSDKNTVHVFALKEGARRASSGAVERTMSRQCSDGAAAEVEGSSRNNPGSWFSVAQGYLPMPSYFQSEWSFAQFRLQESSRAYVGFHDCGEAESSRLFVVTKAGGFYCLRLNAQSGGTMEQEKYESFAESPNTGGAVST